MLHRLILIAVLLVLPGVALAQGVKCSGPGAPAKIVALSISSVTTGGSAVTALPSGGASCGGVLITANSAGICVDQTTTAGTATGTPSTTMCVGANVPFYLAPNVNAVSVNSTGSSVAFAGEGLN